MAQRLPDEPLDVAKADNAGPFASGGAGSPHYIDPQTGYFGFLSPPGTPPVTSEEVKRLLEDFQ